MSWSEVDRRAALAHGAAGDRRSCSRWKTSSRQAHHRPGRSRHRHQQGPAPLPCRPQGSAPADWLLRLPGPHGRGQDLPREHAGRVHVRRRRDALIQLDMCEYMEKFTASRARSARLPDTWATKRAVSVRGGAPPSVLRGPVRRNGKGPPGCDAPAPADPGGRQDHGFNLAARSISGTPSSS